MVVTKSGELAKRALHFRGQGLADNREYWHDVVGYNYRITNICAAIGLAQLERADEFLSKKRSLAKKYQDQLAGLRVEVHGEAPNTTHSYWMISILVENPEDRDRLREHLREKGIETRPLFYQAHTMPMYAAKRPSFPVAEDICLSVINLPSWPRLADAQVQTITSAIAGYFRNSR